jgi:hypothetical protein
MISLQNESILKQPSSSDYLSRVTLMAAPLSLELPLSLNSQLWALKEHLDYHSKSLVRVSRTMF